MFNGSSGIPQLGFQGTPSIDTNKVFDTRELVNKVLAPNAKPAPSLAERLAEARFKMHVAGAAAETTSRCDALIVEHSALCETIETFLIESQLQHVAALQVKRADLWAKCREAENAEKAALSDLGRLNALLNGNSAEVNAWQTKYADAARQPYDTSFPTIDELNSWNVKRAAVKAELDRHEDRQKEIQREMQFAKVARHQAVEELHKLVEQLRAADTQLNNCRKT
jgi:hypothetical protein